MGVAGTYVADVYGLAPLTISCREVGESIGWNRNSWAAAAAKAASPGATTAAAAIATSSTVTSAECTATSAKSTTTAETATEAAASTKATATAKATSHSRVGEAVNANFEDTSLPVVAVELLDRITSIIRRFEDNDAGAFGSAVRSKMDISADDTSSASFDDVPLVS